MPRRTHGYEMDMDDEQDKREPDDMGDESDKGNTGDIEGAGDIKEFREDKNDVEMKKMKGIPNGRIRSTAIRIDTGSHPPIRQRAYRTPIGKWKQVEQEIQKMMDEGFILPSNLEWTLPINFVRKKPIEPGDQVVLVAQERAPLDAKWDHQYSVTRVRGPVLTVINMRTGKRRVINRDKVKLVDPDLEWSDVRPRPTRTARRPINVPAPAPAAQLPATQPAERAEVRDTASLKRRRTDSLDSDIIPPRVRRSQRLVEKRIAQKRAGDSDDENETKRRCLESPWFWSVWAQSAQQISSQKMVSISLGMAPRGSSSQSGQP